MINTTFVPMPLYNSAKPVKAPQFGTDVPVITDVNEANFQHEVIDASKRTPVLVKFYAEWCGPCHRYAPEFMAHADKALGQVKSTQFNAGDKTASGKLRVSRTMLKYGVTNIPTTILFKNGEPVEKFIGVHTQKEIADKLNQHL